MKKDEDDDYNVFRHSLLRYAGYANEVGESFRYQFPRLVVPSYIVSFGYCFADAGCTGYHTYNQSASSDHQLYDTARDTVDTLLWQSLASVMIPGATINLIVKASRLAVGRARLPILLAQWLPTATGLGSIALIVKPIDDAVDYAMDHTTRTWWKKKG
jgi:fission process protein 1